MKDISLNRLNSILETLSTEYEVIAPIHLHDGTRSLGQLEEGALAISGGQIGMRMNTVFFPQFDHMLTISQNNFIHILEISAKPILLIGFSAEDLDCLEFTDKFYGEGFRDDLYWNRRERSIIVAVSGKCGSDGAFMRIAGGKCDLELIGDGDKFIVSAYTEKGRSIFNKITSDEEVTSIDYLMEESNAIPRDDKDVINIASDLIINEKVPDTFWNEIAELCIECTSCNNVCPTCTCFEVYDRDYGSEIERNRLWDSCQLSGFMREASGHNPLGTQTHRTRRRIHHKLAADRIRWGHITCFSCGRCDEACPTGIGMLSVCKEIVKRFS